VVLLLASFAILFCWGGAQAIATRTYRLEWREQGGLMLGPIIVGGGAKRGVDTYQGVDAIRMGVGFLAAGAMFGIWSATVLFCGLIGWRPAGRLQMFGQSAAAASLLCLLLLSACFFPPWQLWATWFWGEMLLWTAFLGAS